MGISGTKRFDTLPAALQHYAETAPAHVLCSGKDGQWRAGDIQVQVTHLASALAVAGIGRGDRVALCADNSISFAIVYFAVLRLGAVIVPLNTRWNSQQLLEALELTRPAVFVSTLPVSDSSAIAETLPVIQANSYETIGSWLSENPISAPKPSCDRPQPDDLAALLFTGGTTGTLKAAMLSHHNLVANAYQFLERIGYGSTDTVAAVLPWFHAFGLTVSLNAPLFALARIAIPERFEPMSCRSFISDENVTHLPAVPPMLASLAGGPARHTRLRMAICGAGYLPDETRCAFEHAFAVPIVEGYGLTEASPVTHCNPPSANRSGTVGPALAQTDTRLIDLNTGAPVDEPGHPGEVLIRGPQVMRGYWGAPSETRDILRDGWLHTGDIGLLNAAGYLQIVDRRKRMLKIKGENVYPARVEATLLNHPAISDVAVVGHASIPNQLIAFYVPSPGQTANPEVLINHCRETLSSIEIPQRWLVVEGLPRNSVGKLLRTQIEALADRLVCGLGAADDAATMTPRS